MLVVSLGIWCVTNSIVNKNLLRPDNGVQTDVAALGNRV